MNEQDLSTCSWEDFKYILRVGGGIRVVSVQDEAKYKSHPIRFHLNRLTTVNSSVQGTRQYT